MQPDERREHVETPFAPATRMTAGEVKLSASFDAELAAVCRILEKSHLEALGRMAKRGSRIDRAVQAEQARRFKVWAGTPDRPRTERKEEL